jgi:hypothetical protein
MKASEKIGSSGVQMSDSVEKRFETYIYKTNEMHQFLKFILFCSSNLHVSDDLSVHHQESKTVHTASGVCQTDYADFLLAGTRWNWFDIYLMLYVKS